MSRSVPSSDTEPFVVDCTGEGEGKGAVGLSENRGSDVREMGYYFEPLRVGFKRGSRGEESADGLGERRGRFGKNLTRRNRNGGSRDRAFRRTTLLSFSRGCDSLGIGGVALGVMVMGGHQ